MNNPNPFVPKGSLIELQTKRRSRLKLAVFCSLAVGVAGLSAMLINGCKREQPAETADTGPTAIDTTVTPTTSVTDTSPPPMTATSTVPVPPPYVPPTPPAPATTEYVVVKGDSLATIAKAHGVKLKDLETANPGVVPTKLKIGYKLQIPAPTASPVAPTTSATGADTGAATYTVKSGDVLAKIAKNQGVKLKELEAANPNVDPNHIKVGQKLKIPAKADAGTTVTATAPVSTTPAASMSSTDAPPLGATPSH
jgi:LysM repeat protein